MELKQAILMCLAAFALLEFGLLPRLKNAWGQLTLTAKLKRLGFVAVCEKLRNYFLVAGLAYAALGLLVVLAGAGATGSPDAIANTLARAQKAGEVVKRFKDFWSTWIFLLAFSVLALAWYRSAKKYALEKLRDLRDREYKRLLKAREEHSPEWQNLPPTAEMSAVQSAFQKAAAALDHISAEESESASALDLKRYTDELARLWTVMDLDRRIEIRWETEPVAVRRGPLASFFTSKGFLADMKGAGKLLSYASTAFLALALVGFAAGSTDRSLSHRAAHLADLKITAEERKSEEDLRRAEAEASAESARVRNNQPLSADERARVRGVSQTLARGLRSNSRWPETARDLRCEVAKERIRALTSADTPAAADQLPEHLAPAAPRVDPLAESIESHLTAEAERSPQFRAKFRAWLASHQEPAEIGDLRDYFVEQLTDKLFESVPKPHAALTEKAADLFTDPVKSRAAKALKTAENRLMVAMLRDPAGDSVWEAARGENLLRTVLTPSVFEDLAKQFPDPATQAQWAESVRRQRLAALSQETEPGAERVRRVVADMSRLSTFDHETELANLASTYESEFPLGIKNYVRDSLVEDLAKSRKAVQDALRGAGQEIPDMAPVENAAARAARSTSVEALRNFGRVGGILIGRPPDGKPVPAHVNDLRWTQQAGSLTLLVYLATGRPVTLGPFPADMVNRALAYAADGRVTAVTVLRAELIDRDQVMVHPALRDTELGGRFGRADEWIFEVLDPDPPAPRSDLRRSLERLYADSKIYEKALAVVKDDRAATREIGIDRLRALQDVGARAALSGAASFDRQLLALSVKCAAAGGGEEAFSSCVRKGVIDKTWEAALKRASAPRTQFVSQIFEQPYQVDSNLSFLQPMQRDDGIWPLEFTVQMVVNDKEHVTFPQFQPPAKQSSTAAVLKGIQERGEIAALQDLRRFALLQRFFRIALEGQLGDDFPVEKLADLAEATHNPTTSCPTPRWIHRKGILGDSREAAIAADLRRLPASSTFAEPAPQNAALRFRLRMKECAALLDGAKAEQLPAERVRMACSAKDHALEIICGSAKSPGASEACFMVDVAFTIDLIVHTHQLREALEAVNVPRHIATVCVSRPAPSARARP